MVMTKRLGSSSAVGSAQRYFGSPGMPVELDEHLTNSAETCKMLHIFSGSPVVILG